MARKFWKKINESVQPEQLPAAKFFVYEVRRKAMSRKITQNELAKVSGYSQSAISKVLNETLEPGLTESIRLARHLTIDLSDLQNRSL